MLLSHFEVSRVKVHLASLVSKIDEMFDDFDDHFCHSHGLLSGKCCSTGKRLLEIKGLSSVSIYICKYTQIDILCRVSIPPVANKEYIMIYGLCNVPSEICI